MTALSGAAARKRFVLLTTLRWLPTGLVAPITTLLALERGLSLAEVGIVVAVQGFVVLTAELPSGAFSDTIGRRWTLIIAGVVGIVSITVFAFAFSLAAFMIAFALQGIWRALDSGALEAWYVDAVLMADEGADFTPRLSSGSSALNLAMGFGALASGGLVSLALTAGMPALVFPVYVAIGLTVANLVAVLALVKKERIRTPGGVFSAMLTGMPAGVLAGLRLVTSSRVLQGSTIVGMGLFAGPVGVVAAYVVCYAMHGASNPAHNTLLHRQATNANRAVVLPINSMIAQPGFAIGALVLGAVAGAASLSLAMIVAAIVLAVAAPLYLPAWRHELGGARNQGL